MSNPNEVMDVEKQITEVLQEFAEAVRLLTLHPEATGEVNDPTAQMLGIIAQQNTALLREIKRSLKERKYKHKHNHDIQTWQDGKYSCQFCRKTVNEIMGEDGMGECPHFQSFNYGLNAGASILEAKLKTIEEVKI